MMNNEDKAQEEFEALLSRLGVTLKIPADGIFKWSIQTHDWEVSDDTSLESLKAKLRQLEEQHDDLDSEEPEADGNAYSDWEDKLNELENLILKLENQIANME